MDGPAAAARSVSFLMVHLLDCLTLGALDLPDLEAVHLMVLLCIMTQPADIEVTTAGGLQDTTT